MQLNKDAVVPVGQAKKNFDFVDTIRCISMIGIVFEHSEQIGVPHYSELSSQLFQASFMQFFKFATIAFFLIAGFLINYKFTEYTPWQYMKNRFKSTIGPWAFWLNIMVLLTVAHVFFLVYVKHESSEMPSDFLAYVGNLYYDVTFFSSFWFILNFLVCIAILLIFKKFIYNKYYGLILGLLSLFYSVNLYYGWIITSHSTAMFGFVFYLWLGAYMNKYYEQVMGFVKRNSIWLFIGVTAVCFVLADIETIYLKGLENKDAYNTLRITNILYSLSFFALLLKIGPIASINTYLQPRKTTFGIYLLHQIILTHVISEIVRPFEVNMDTITLIGAAGYTIVRFLMAYVISMILVRIFMRTRFNWAIGNAA